MRIIFAYIIGDDEGYVRPLDNVTRAETAAILFRLLKEDVREEYLTDRSGFADVGAGSMVQQGSVHDGGAGGGERVY